MRFGVFAILSFSVFLVISTQGLSQEPRDLSALRSLFDEKREALEQPLINLRDSYGKLLERLRSQAAASGDLKLVLAIEDELEMPGERDLEGVENSEALAKHQETYRDELRKRELQRNERLQELVQKYETSLEILSKELTRQERIDEAVEVAKETERAQGLLNLLQAGQDAASLSDLIASGDEKDQGEEIVNTAGIPLVWIPPGRFEMGSPIGESLRGEWEAQFNVTISKGFWMGKFEVTVGHHEAVLGKASQGSKRLSSLHPKAVLSWNNAMEYCEKLTAFETRAGTLPPGWEYRLPTEAEWEYACRAKSRDAFHDDIDKVAWTKDNSGGQSHKVGMLEPNHWGLFDMHGNLSEWCLDYYGEYPKGSATDPTGPSSGLNRISRGGNWFAPSGHCRAASRQSHGPEFKNINLGMRVVLAEKASR